MEETRDFSVFSPIFFHFFEGNALSPLYKPLHFDYNTDILMSGGNSVKEEIYTIPVMDGFKAGTECPFCSMYHQLETDSIHFVLSPSYMEVDVRGETNEKGFCQKHMKQLYDQGNSLGLALMMHSHLKHRIEALDQALSQSEGEKPVKSGWFTKKGASSSGTIPDLRERWRHSCYICDRIEISFSRFLSTFFHMWKKQADFRQLVEQSKGYCLDHFLMLYQEAPQYLSGEDCTSFRQMIRNQETENLARMADELEWFTLKFDYRYKDKPWKNSQDALPRTILKVNSQFVEKDKNA